jgi:MFS family permease
VFEPPLAGSIAALAMVGLLNGPVNPIFFTLIQERTPEELLGRVNGSLIALTMDAAPLGAMLAGWLLDAFRLPYIIAVIAAGMLGVSLLLVLSPALREMDVTKKRKVQYP